MSNQTTEENKNYLTKQIITYIGNKRSLIPLIHTAVEIVKEEIGKNKLNIFEPFSGSGVVSRYFKQHSLKLIVNDLEDYTVPISKCYLSNLMDVNYDKFLTWHDKLTNLLNSNLNSGFITELYAPKDDLNVKLNERAFYTVENAKIIDTAREFISSCPYEFQPLLLAPLLSEASIKVNTCGIFRSFYKNKNNIGYYGKGHDLKRIRGKINVSIPFFSNFQNEVEIYKNDATSTAKIISGVDLTYLDPPYNCHSYGANYFMLNLITNYERPTEITPVAGVPVDWKRSLFNKKRKAKNAFWELLSNIKTKYLLISYNSEGYIDYDSMIEMLSKLGTVKVFSQLYNTFKSCRNLHNRSKHVMEYLFLVNVQ